MKSEKLENIAVALAAMASAVLTGALTLSFGWLIMGLAMQLLAPVASAQTKPAVELEAAITKEQVDGDLQTAIADYRKIAADQSASRDVRANALLHLAGCYEKLGQQARNVYQQIVRDFADQPAASQARARLAALRQDDRPAAPATMTQRKIETLGPEMGPGDTDGHRVVYRNDATGELIFGDLAGKSKRVIFKAKLGDVWGWFPSRDFSIVGLEFPGPPETLAVVKTDGTDYREIAKLDGRSVCGPNWSWDNRYVLCSRVQDGTSHLLKISIADGNIRELLSLKTGEIGTAAFSPDGRFVAYQVHPPANADGVTRIFVEPADGRDPQPVYEERPTIGTSQSLRLLDWTIDGRYLAISSERTGNPALHLLPIKDGKSAGDPVFLRYGAFSSGVTTAAGDLVYSSVKPGGNWAVYLASLDSNSRVEFWKRLDLRLGNTTNPLPIGLATAIKSSMWDRMKTWDRLGARSSIPTTSLQERIARSITPPITASASGRLASRNFSVAKTVVKSIRSRSTPEKSRRFISSKRRLSTFRPPAEMTDRFTFSPVTIKRGNCCDGKSPRGGRRHWRRAHRHPPVGCWYRQTSARSSGRVGKASTCVPHRAAIGNRWQGRWPTANRTTASGSRRTVTGSFTTMPIPQANPACSASRRPGASRSGWVISQTSWPAA